LFWRHPLCRLFSADGLMLLRTVGVKSDVQLNVDTKQQVL
jgi:hypothetical protein